MRNPGRTISATAALIVAVMLALAPEPIWPLIATIAVLAGYNLYTAQIRDKKQR